MEVVLSPALDIEYVTTGYVNFTLECTVDMSRMGGNVTVLFVSLYGLTVENYLTNCELYYKSNANITSGAAPASVNLWTLPTVMGGDVRYEPEPTVGGIQWFWNGNSATSTYTFVDANGNAALCSPVVYYNTGGSGTLVLFMPQVKAELVSSDGYSAVIRLTRSMVCYVYNGGYGPAVDKATAYADYMASGAFDDQSWTGVALAGVADPDDPTNTDKVLVTLGVGNFTYGVNVAWYKAVGTAYNFSGGFSGVLQVYS